MKSQISTSYGILTDLKQSGRQIFDLTGSEVSQVQALAAADVEVSPFAKSLLVRAEGEEWEHPIEKIPVSSQFYKIPIDEIQNELAESSLGEAVPNPAGGITTISVYISQKDADLKPELMIYSITGSQVFKQALKAGENKVQINTQEWNPGLYFYSFQRNGQNIATKKLSITK